MWRVFINRPGIEWHYSCSTHQGSLILKLSFIILTLHNTDCVKQHRDTNMNVFWSYDYYIQILHYWRHNYWRQNQRLNLTVQSWMYRSDFKEPPLPHQKRQHLWVFSKSQRGKTWEWSWGPMSEEHLLVLPTMVKTFPNQTSGRVYRYHSPQQSNRRKAWTARKRQLNWLIEIVEDCLMRRCQTLHSSEIPNCLYHCIWSYLLLFISITLLF